MAAFIDAIMDGKGFALEFDNGYKVSVQWSAAHYCDNRRKDWRGDSLSDRCDDAEVAVIAPDGEFIKLDEFDDIIGFVTPDKLVRILSAVQQGDIDTIRYVEEESE